MIVASKRTSKRKANFLAISNGNSLNHHSPSLKHLTIHFLITPYVIFYHQYLYDLNYAVTM